MNPLDDIRPDASGLVRRHHLLDSGFVRSEIDGLRRPGALLPVRRGVYRLPHGPLPPPARAHRLRAVAALADLGAGAVFGHVTAALLLGLPTWGLPLDRLHVIKDRPGGGRIRAGTHVRCAPLPPGDVVEIDRVPITASARTMADLARTAPIEQALVTVDAALHASVVCRRGDAAPHPGATAKAEIDEVLVRRRGRRGAPRARRLPALADALSESPGESRSRYRMHLAALPAPVTQWPVPGTPRRTDFAWPECGIVGEFDGRVKYGRTLRPDDDPADTVWREKRREDRIRAIGLVVVRWVWSEIADEGPDGMVARLRRHLAHPMDGPRTAGVGRVVGARGA